MGGDHRYYYDFDSETKLENWSFTKLDDRHARLECRIGEPAGDYIFLALCLPEEDRYLPHLEGIQVNGVDYPVRKSDARYVHDLCFRYGIRIRLTEGDNVFSVRIKLPENGVLKPEELFFSLIAAEAPPKRGKILQKMHHFEKREYDRNLAESDFSGWQKGAGREISPGRFGFSKGDGLLDCAMPELGIVDKMFLCGQPKYKKPYSWSYSLLPEGMPLHGSYSLSDVGIEDDEIKVNHLSVKWSADFKGKSFSCTYSLASPGILTESENGSMRLADLRYAGNYQSILIPRENGIEENALDEAAIAGMAENWILLFNSTEFPDVPLMLVFDRNPESMKILRDSSGRLDSIEFAGCPLMLSCTPFGIERFDPGKMVVGDAVRRCRFWSRALLAYPVRSRDYFRLDEDHQKVTIRQKFEYRYIEDVWKTEPLELAPLPPPLSICGTSECPVAEDFEFPSKYGWLRGRIGCWSEYSIPFMPLERKFPLCSEHSEIPELLRQGMEKYRKVVSAFGPDKVSYPYAGAILEPFAFASTLAFFMNDADRDFLRKNMEQRLKVALDAEAQSDYTVINWGEMMRDEVQHDEVIRIYQGPDKKHMMLWNWYDRVEPFTGAAYKICYLNLGLFSGGTIKTGTREEVLKLKNPLIENDWGVGLTFYYLYLSALQCGSFEEIRCNWELIKGVYAFFDRMHDWACMGTGYSDNGITWVEGANYGLFPAYIRMAEAVHDSEARAFGIYNAAKQLALRLAIVRASLDYFPRYFDTEPWYCAKAFHEESHPNFAFQNVPALSDQRVRSDAVYNFTTEGMYPETYTALRRFGGAGYAEIMRRLEDGLRNGQVTLDFQWGLVQQYAGILIDKALNPSCSREDFNSALKAGEEKDLIMKQWRGIHIFSRVLPENYLRCQLLAWMEMRQHKLWLEHWEEMRIQSARWISGKAEISFVPSGKGNMRLECGVSQTPKAVLLDNSPVPFREFQSGKIEICPESGGILTVLF